eukprot:gene12830-12958_t
MMIARVDLQWFWLLLFAFITVPFAPWTADPVQFFRGGIVSDSKKSATDASNLLVLSSSAFVSWIFAKGILNTSTLGASFGVVGGLAYSAWFVAFFSVAFVAYYSRTRHGYRSLPQAIHARYGGLAAMAFGLAVAYRLEQEVWSNSLVVASFYGPVGSGHWWAAAIVSTAIPAFYCFTGGMRASLFTDVFQGALSYPYFDPVLTDRAFLGEPGTMVRAFVAGGIMAILFIFLFSFVGIFGAMAAVLRPETVPCDIYAGMLGGQPAAVAKYFGTAVFSIVNLIFLISSCTVLDSTFASTSKLFGPELMGSITRGRPLPPQMATQRHAWAGRIAIVLMAAVGTLPLIAGPSALDATTISGTMVVGLGPPIFFLTFIKGYRPLVFHIPFWCGVAFGIVMQLSNSPCCKDFMNVSGFKIGNGHYALLLGFNVVSTVCCWALGGIALLDNYNGHELVTYDDGEHLGTSDTLTKLPTNRFDAANEAGSNKDAAMGEVKNEVGP